MNFFYFINTKKIASDKSAWSVAKFLGLNKISHPLFFPILLINLESEEIKTLSIFFDFKAASMGYTHADLPRIFFDILIG